MPKNKTLTAKFVAKVLSLLMGEVAILRAAEYAKHGRRFEHHFLEELHERYVTQAEIHITQGWLPEDTFREYEDIMAEFTLRGYVPQLSPELQQKQEEFVFEGLKRIRSDPTCKQNFIDNVDRHLRHRHTWFGKPD